MKLYQKLAEQIGEIIETEVGIMDKTGVILGCTNEARVGDIHPSAVIAANSDDLFSSIDGSIFQKIYSRNKLESIAWIGSADENSKKFLSLISINVAGIRSFYEDKFDKNVFIRSLIYAEIPASDVARKAKEFHINVNSPRLLFIVKIEGGHDENAFNVLESLFPNRTRDTVVALDEKTIVLVREIKQDEGVKNSEKLAMTIIDTLNTELMIKARVGIGNTVKSIDMLAAAYKNAEMAIEVGSIFDKDKTVLDYNKMGLSRLIYHLPADLCNMFLNEVPGGDFFGTMDDETLLTVQKLFENNLNISEASRQLYVHRNTMVYRLDKVQKSTGLDLRSFDDAITFKICMMVRKYLDKLK